MGKGRYGNRLMIRVKESEDGEITIAPIYEYKNAKRHNPKGYIDLSPSDKWFQGRPLVVLKRFIDWGFDKDFYDRSLINKLIEFGFDRGYWKDTQVFAEPFKYFLLDRSRRKSKEKRLAELRNDGITALPKGND